MNELSRRLINGWQGGFPLCERPFAVVAERLDASEDAVLQTLRELLADGTLTRFGPLYQIERLGGAFSLAALQAPEAEFDRIAGIVNGFPEVAHNYRRDHAFNMWFVLATETPAGMNDTVERIAAATGLPVFNFPKEREYFIEARFAVGAGRVENSAPASPKPNPQSSPIRGSGVSVQALRPLILATQAGLPLTPQPYHALAAQLGSDAETVMAGLQTLAGRWRDPPHRGGAESLPHRLCRQRHDGVGRGRRSVDELGEWVGALEFVTHGYRRPRHLPDWPYNLFAMAHGASRDEVAAKADRIAEILGDACRARAILYSTRILKKTGLRLRG